MEKRRYRDKHTNIKRKDKFLVTKNTIIIFSIIAAFVSAIAYLGIQSMIPVNGNSPILGAPKNNFMKASHHPQSGYLFIGQSGGKSVGQSRSNINSNYNNASNVLRGPTLYVSKGGLESIHFINEDYDTHSRHNLNIDEFNVHTRDLGYFQSQTITFIVDKSGDFEYYCSLHPEMRGKVVVI